tara:strand:- start:4282 stop:5040 length:759 start_codon:yes stop_codon:yes gene_type:complete
MGLIVDLLDKVKRYYAFTLYEFRGFVIATIVIAFIISFSDWGSGESVNLTSGFFNFFNAILIVALSMIIHISAQKVWALGTGYRLEWKMWGFGLLAGLIFVFLTNGKFWLILPGGFIVHHLGGHRLGWFRYGLNWWALGLIALMGPLASIVLAGLFKVVSGFVVNSLIQKLIVFNIAYALYSMLPIPPLDGSQTFYGSRMLYAFSTAGIVTAAILFSLDISVGIAVIASFLVGVVLWVLYYIFFESEVWHGG